eukprot:6535492-Pyramimonas_sp.AAC.2
MRNGCLSLFQNSYGRGAVACSFPHTPLNGVVLDFIVVVVDWHASRNVFIPRVLYVYTTFSVSKRLLGPWASTPTEQTLHGIARPV